jgi:hypothetical protein
MPSLASCFVVASAAFAINFVSVSATAQDQGNIRDGDIWHEVKLYCDTEAKEAIITIRGTSFRGLHETPAAIKLTLADKVVLQSWQYFDCHEGYAASAIILNDGALKFCSSELDCAETGKLLIHAD